MRYLLASISCVALLAAACGPDSMPTLPAPVPPAPSPSSPTPPPTSGPPARFSDRYRDISVGDVIHGVVRADDPLCIEEPLWPCQYFRITVPNDGTLEVLLTHSAGNLDVSVKDTAGRMWWDPRPVQGQPRVQVPSKAGQTYQIAVWQYESPGVEFELRTSLRPE